MQQTLVVFDIETIPDTQAASVLTGSEATDVPTLREALRQYHLDATDGRNDFPRQPFHQVVSIAAVEVEVERVNGGEQYHFRRCFSNQSHDEAEMIRGFMDWCHKLRPRLVTFNGRNFDVPVLQFRAMKHGIQAGWLFRAENKWENYKARYAQAFHTDLLDVMRDFGGMQGGLKLNEVATILGLPGKTGVDGSKVAEMYDNGDIQSICDYCETDVLNTYLVYLRWQHLTGVLATEGLVQATQEVYDYLLQAQEQPHYKEFLDAWQAVHQQNIVPLNNFAELEENKKEAS